MNIDLTAPENKKMLAIMKDEHPGVDTYILEQSLRFYRAGVLDELAREPKKKKKGRPHKQPAPITEIRGAVSIKSEA